ncbi:plasma-membrane proton-efflux P-type ATPase [Rhizopus microsporus var. microsporus]|uniref:Plasma membrane ATPase n=2 Tax=Rhizopus microsporus TaxID=58291 RepID=A0A2G4SWZ1_RHIZD|nr:H(+)-ATPase [Rhizopus microsporus ATCC 52813]ORE03094.1 plasma-membrane proton-efflux P-type ATPase [Rhizopus microsporus var. microsporus]PHZ13265.1 H(+)-ATPase [Rhizopus microsporus ATCC 52813]
MLPNESIPLESITNTEKEWKDEISPEVEVYLDTKPTYGLTEQQVAERLTKFGKNELQDKKKSKIKHFLSFFTGAIAYLMEISIILTAVTKDWVDFGIILSMLIINALIGYIEEAKADSAVAALKTSLALHTRCWRSGQLMEINAAELVVGDVIVLRLGDIVPADVRLLGIGATGEQIEGDLQIDQSALTGESLPVRKRKGDLVYSSSIVKQGQQLGIVVRTGSSTFIGRAANLISVTTDAGHFQKVVNYIGNFLIAISVLLVTIIFIYDLVEKKIKTGVVTGPDVLDALKEMVVLTIAAIPVGLPTVMSVTMAVGAKQLAKKKVIVKRLTSVEEFASVSILCSDKTGTLTLNELTFDEPYLAPPFTKSDLLLHAYLSSEPATSDPIEFAVRNAAERNHPIISTLEGKYDVPGYQVKSFKPFDPVEKMSRAVVLDKTTQSTFKVAKGAPQVILELVNNSGLRPIVDAEKVVVEFAQRGLRALGVARTKPKLIMDDSGDEWELIGIFSLIDPPRHDSAMTIRDCSEYGISVKMITGDQTIIAKEVAQRLNMGQNILDANSLVDSAKSDTEIAERCLHVDGFARVVPEHKYRVVELLQDKGYFVAMTGDGVNDAPALKKANVGIAVHGSTDAARTAADIVLLTPGLSPIVDGIKTSRAIFQRLQSYALYRISSTIHFLIFFFVITLAEDWQMPPIFLILISVLNDAATMIMTIDNVTISKHPNTWRLRLLVFLSTILAVFLSFFSFAHFYIFRDVIKVTPGQLSTVMYLHISAAPHFIIFSTRTESFCWRSLPSWPFTVVVLGTQVIALFLSVYGAVGDATVEGIGWAAGLAIIAVALITFILVDLVKVLTIHLWNKRHVGNNIRVAVVQKNELKPSRVQRFQQEHSGSLNWSESS